MLNTYNKEKSFQNSHTRKLKMAKSIASTHTISEYMDSTHSQILCQQTRRFTKENHQFSCRHQKEIKTFNGDKKKWLSETKTCLWTRTKKRRNQIVKLFSYSRLSTPNENRRNSCITHKHIKKKHTHTHSHSIGSTKSAQVHFAGTIHRIHLERDGEHKTCFVNGTRVIAHW